MFVEANLQEVQGLKSILKEYEVNSGQCVNFDKVLVFFSMNILARLCTTLTRELGVHHSCNTEKYFGLSNVVGHNKKALVLSLKDRMQKKKEVG